MPKGKARSSRDERRGAARVESQRTAAAAQAYVEAMLIRRGMWTHRPILENQEGFDLVCTSRERQRHMVRVQVKGRWATDAGGPNIQNERLDDFDYLALVRLNAGYYYSMKGKPGGVKPPEIYVFPGAVVKKYFRKGLTPGKGWGGKFQYEHVPHLKNYEGDAGLDRIAAELRVPGLEAHASKIVAGHRRRARSS